MDATVDSMVDANLRNVYNLFLNADDADFSSTVNRRNTVIKFAKLPPHEEHIRGDKDDPLNQLLNPRLRRFITLNDSNANSPRSLRTTITVPTKTTPTPRRKIATIVEDDDTFHPNFSARTTWSTPKTVETKVVETEFKESKPNINRNYAKPWNSARQYRDPKLRPTRVIVKTSNSTRPGDDTETTRINLKPTRERASSRESKARPANVTMPRSPPKSKSTPERTHSSEAPKGDYRAPKARSETAPLYPKETLRPNPPARRRAKPQGILKLNNGQSTLHVDLNGKEKNERPAHMSRHQTPVRLITKRSQSIDHGAIKVPLQKTPEEPTTPPPEKKEVAVSTDMVSICKDQEIITEPMPEKVDRVTQMEAYREITCQYKMSDIKINENMFDSLNVPNVSLTNKTDEQLSSKSMPNLQVPSLKISPSKRTASPSSLSFIIGEATLTYTTKQKINFHVVEQSSPQHAPSMAYPISVVSLYRNQIKSEEALVAKKSSHTNNALVKPSELIRTIRMNNQLANEVISEQFVRELNFIDSFFESLQYLDSCLWSECSVGLRGADPMEYGKMIASLDLQTDDAHTMASNTLCLLNLLIRDEQRRAKNLLFVLKMREDALKDFTKSQILWLENKKKHDSDIPTLKKKQRGALLKLQQECGEMQRMRKALLALSEKRKAALMKTKKNIELKLKSNVDVDTILAGKKKISRVTADKSTAPLKCFELSSSCDDGTSQRRLELGPSLSVDKTAQTSEVAETNLNMTLKTSVEIVNQSIETNLVKPTAAEDCVVVDGGYLNILFKNLHLPHMFSNGKQYEVNEKALKDVLFSATSQLSTADLSGLIEEFKGKTEADASTSPSTARSLVEEFNQFYNGIHLSDEDKYFSSEDDEYKRLFEMNRAGDVREGLTGLEEGPVVSPVPAGPLPVPPGESADSADTTGASETSSRTSLQTVSSNAEFQIQASPSEITLQSPLPTPVDEAERLRKQQLAIEREIKALEQQQCMLLVREIPDKPPPPYTPPVPLTPAPKKFAVTPEIAQNVTDLFVRGETEYIGCEGLDAFVKDFCDEFTKSREQAKDEDTPWDPLMLINDANIEEEVDLQGLAESAVNQLKDVLTPVPVSSVSGLGTRRSDHIDDVLTSEWRFREREWTALHSQDQQVKEQLAQSILFAAVDDAIKAYKDIHKD